MQPVEARAQSVDALKREEAAAQRAADQAAAEVTAAISEQNLITDEVLTVRATISAKELKRDELSGLAIDRAVEAYKGSQYEVNQVFESQDLLEASRRARLLGTVTKDDNETIDLLAVQMNDLARDHERLDALLEQQRKIVAAKREAEARLEARLADLTRKRKALEARLAAQAAARRSAGGGGGSFTAGAAPAPVGGLVCPLPGSAFVDSWGAPRSGGRRHKGTDMMAPFGRPVYAVVGGSMRHTSGGLGGLGIWLSGNDGNVYYYAHLQSFNGGPRSVSQGELIGTNGNTGNARGGAPHVHFEIKIGGGASVNPYPTLRRIC